MWICLLGLSFKEKEDNVNEGLILCGEIHGVKSFNNTRTRKALPELHFQLDQNMTLRILYHPGTWIFYTLR